MAVVVVSYRNSTSNHNISALRLELYIVVSYRNSTSNHNHESGWPKQLQVVSYRNSTSNHNSYVGRKASGPVVSYRNSTSNHNCWVLRRICLALYLIEILHQTTTFGRHFPSNDSCILSKFYIKPQLTRIRPYSAIVVSYRNSTSNHNLARQQVVDEVLYLIEILHQTTTLKRGPFKAVGLYLIEILHQTTTSSSTKKSRLWLYLIEILHQTTTGSNATLVEHGCILSKFYIKPQLKAGGDAEISVVSYRNSTSNHNQLSLGFDEL